VPDLPTDAGRARRLNECGATQAAGCRRKQSLASAPVRIGRLPPDVGNATP